MILTVVGMYISQLFINLNPFHVIFDDDAARDDSIFGSERFFVIFHTRPPPFIIFGRAIKMSTQYPFVFRPLKDRDY